MDCKTTETERSLITKLVNAAPLNTHLSEPFGSGNWQISKKLLHAGQSHGQGYKLLPNGGALKILGAAQRENDFFLLCQELTCQTKFAEGFSCWKNPDADQSVSLLPLKFLETCQTAVLKREERKDAKNNLFLLLGLKKTS